MRSIYRVQRERAEAGEFCESRRLEAQLGIAVKRERPRQVPPSTPFYISTKGVCIMQINKLSQSNSTSFNGYVNVKCIDGKLVRVKKGMPGSINLFIAGGKGIDEKVALANKNLVLKSKPLTKENKPNSILMFFAGMLSTLGFDKSLNNLLKK